MTRSGGGAGALLAFLRRRAPAVRAPWPLGGPAGRRGRIKCVRTPPGATRTPRGLPRRAARHRRGEGNLDGASGETSRWWREGGNSHLLVFARCQQLPSASGAACRAGGCPGRKARSFFDRPVAFRPLFLGRPLCALGPGRFYDVF